MRVADDVKLDIKAFLRGAIKIDANTQCVLLCPIRGVSIPVDAVALEIMMSIPGKRWLNAVEIERLSEAKRRELLDLARLGLLVADPAVVGWEDLGPAEEALEQTGWHELAAIYHAHSRWEGVVGHGSEKDEGEATEDGIKKWVQKNGPAPSEFSQRRDVIKHVKLCVPHLEGTFFTALLDRRTTRAFCSDLPLALTYLESMLYVVFGAQAVKHMDKGLSLIKRTSPSAGALHPIDAYILILNVENVHPGLYHYDSSTHSLAQITALGTEAARELACDFTAGQTYFARAHALIIHVARFDRTFWKYARHRKAYNAVLMDSAHLSQTFYLTAAHLGLGAFYTCAINDVDIGRELRLSPQREAAIGINGLGVIDHVDDQSIFSPLTS